MLSKEKILNLTRSLLPRGRAFRMPQGGTMEKVFSGLAISEAKLMNDAVSIFDSIIPDNANFTEDDALMWEKKLGIRASSSTPLSVRMEAIRQKYNYPTTEAARQHWHFIQDQLQAAGFNVFIHENEDGVSPDELLFTMHASTGIYHGVDEYMGAGFSEFVVSHLEEEIDRDFVVGDNWYSTFFIGGETFPNFAEVPADRKEELRHLILQLKPTQTVGILFINFI